MTLVRALLFLEGGWLAGLVFRPVDLTFLQGIEVDFQNRRLLVVEGVSGVPAPVIGGGDDVTECERFLTGGGEEAVDVGFPDAVVRGVAFALNSVVFLRAAGAGDEVDAGVLGGEAELRAAGFLYPVCVQPDVGIKVRVGGLKPEEGADELLEVGAFLPLGLGGGTVGSEDALEGGHG